MATGITPSRCGCGSVPNRNLERVKGIEPSSQAWEARILPLNHTRVRALLSSRLRPAAQ
jgi:hypothetical protein